jgi:hypothetical protein
MATVKLNGQTSPSNMLCFSDSINIVEYNDNISGTKATITLTFSSGLSSTVTADSQYYITILDETITNVMSPKNATNKRFYISSGESSTAAYVANALSACESLVADWNISNNAGSVYMTAKTIGQKLTNVQSAITTNITTGLTISSGDGSVSSSVFGGKVLVQISGMTDIIRLEKSIYDNYVQFNISPILSSFANYGSDVPFTMSTNTLGSDGTYLNVGAGITNYTTYGYLANQSVPYMSVSNRIMINDKRGNNDQILYTYSNTIPFTVMSTSENPNGSWTAYNSALGFIASGNTAAGTLNGHLADLQAVVPTTAFSQAYYIDISFQGQTVRFNVIKPVKMAEGYTRVYWRNEYGGISFFDFTGQRSETDTAEVETYNKSFYSFYNNSNTFDGKAPYTTKATKEVKVTSHLLEEDGKYISNSLIRSKRMWTYVNGNLQYIVQKAIEVNEDQNYNGVYTITFTFEYSQLS